MSNEDYESAMKVEVRDGQLYIGGRLFAPAGSAIAPLMPEPSPEAIQQALAILGASVRPYPGTALNVNVNVAGVYDGVNWISLREPPLTKDQLEELEIGGNLLKEYGYDFAARILEQKRQPITLWGTQSTE